MMKTGEDPLDIIRKNNMKQDSDAESLKSLAEEILRDNQKSISDYKNGKTNALGFIIGQCMKKSQGKANPTMVRDIILKMIS